MSMDPIWEEYGRRRSAFWSAIRRIPRLMIIIFLTSGVLGVLGLNANLIFAALSLSVGIYLQTLSLRVLTYPCPRCNKSLHLKLVYCILIHGALFSRRCIYCGLPLWTPGPF